MGFIFGIVRKLLKFSLYFIIFAAVIVLIPNLPPYTKFTSIPLEPTQPLVGQLAWNDALGNPELILKGKLLGPEALRVHNGELYTGLATGEIVKISPGGHITFVTKIGQPCAGRSEEHICGRPLGFEIDSKTNQLYVADAYLGIWKVDLKTDKKQLLVSPRVAVGGRQPKLFNSIALADNGDFYWTDSTSDFSLKDGAYSVLTDPSGRLFYYNAAKNESKVLLDDLWFANGVAISPDKQFVVACETSRYRIMKYYINGPKKGQSEIFVDGLPGTPDNLIVLPDGSGFLAALYSAFDEEHPLLTRSISEIPLARKFLVRIQMLIEMPFDFLNKQFPHPILDDIVYNLGHFKSVSGFLWDRTGLVQMDWNGNIVAAYYSANGDTPHFSDAVLFNNKLYMGAPNQDFLTVAPIPPQLKKAFTPIEKEIPKPKAAQTQQAKVEQKKTEPKVEEKKTQPKEEKREQPKAKPQEAPKPTAAPTPKPTEPPTTPKPSEKPVTQAPSAPKATSPPPQAKVQPKPAEAKATPKQAEPKATPAQNTPKTEAPKNVKPETQKPPKANPKPDSGKPAPQQIPINEEIPSDTAKPNKETLKVITKGGPTEIPNPTNV